MSVHEDLLNNGENNCSFTEDEVDIMCSKDGDDACGVCDSTSKKRYLSRLSCLFSSVFGNRQLFSGEIFCYKNDLV